ncbi:MAG: DUF4126 family protein [Candidatus Elarobacter sp.]
MDDAAPRYVRAFGIGFVSGMRSMTGPAAVRIRAGGPSAVVVPLLALGELVVDKLPGVPERTTPASVVLRALSGGYAGSFLARERADRRIAFALGAAGALAGTYAMLELRRAATRKTGLPDPVIALVEDVAAISAGLLLSA